MSTRIFVATHKKYDITNENGYMPILAGSEVNHKIDGYVNDNKGDNISDKNIRYCELTALYWIWKNTQYNTVGLVHYRRYLSIDGKKAISISEINEIMRHDKIILPPKRKYIETIKDHYINCIKSRKADNRKQIEYLEKVIHELNPEYDSSFKKVINSHSAHMLNMFIMEKDILNEYCKWLFGILFKLEGVLENENIMYERIMGAFSEFLLDVWLDYNNYEYTEVKLYETEKNLLKKILWASKRRFID